MRFLIASALAVSALVSAPALAAESLNPIDVKPALADLGPVVPGKHRNKRSFGGPANTLGFRGEV